MKTFAAEVQSMMYGEILCDNYSCRHEAYKAGFVDAKKRAVEVASTADTRVSEVEVAATHLWRLLETIEGKLKGSPRSELLELLKSRHSLGISSDGWNVSL